MKDRIAIQAYTELMISCQEIGCTEDFAECFQHLAYDPVEEWASDMAKKARDAGWTLGEHGQVLCPNHSNLKSCGQSK